MIPVFEPEITFKDKVAVYRAMSKKNISGTSPEIKEFEQELAQFFERKYVVTVSNGSTALDLALQCIDFEPGDEVIVPSFTIISCLSSIIRAGAVPKFCDVSLETWNMSLSDVEKVYTKNTKAVLMVHTYGLAADAERISKFCEDSNIILIEDSAEAHGQKVNQKKCGSFGLISTLSFYANKHVTSGEGGAVLTDDPHIAKKVIQMKNLDFTSKKRFYHENFYWNYRLGSLQAALGRSSLKRIHKTISMKIEQASFYDNLFQPYSDLVKTPLKNYENTRNHYWVYGILLNEGIERDTLIEKLLADGIETRPFFWPLHLQNAFTKLYSKKTNCFNSEYLGRNGLYIPIGSHVTPNDQTKVVKKILSHIERAKNI